MPEVGPRQLAMLCFIIFLLFYLFLTVVGSVGFHKCPAGPYIPLFLIVSGVAVVIAIVLEIVKTFIQEYSRWMVVLTVITSLLYIADFVFFILGSIIIWQIFEPSYHEEDGREYCAKYVYYSAVALVTIMYAAIIFSISFGCCFLLVWLIRKRNTE